jgi:hypothetical protein
LFLSSLIDACLFQAVDRGNAAVDLPYTPILPHAPQVRQWPAGFGFEKFEEGATAGRDVADIVVCVKRGDGCRRAARAAPGGTVRPAWIKTRLSETSRSVSLVPFMALFLTGSAMSCGFLVEWKAIFFPPTMMVLVRK